MAILAGAVQLLSGQRSAMHGFPKPVSNRVKMPDALDHLEEIESPKRGLLAFVRCAGSRHARRHILLMLKSIRDARKAGRWWETQQLIRPYLTSHDARLAATHRAFGKMKPGRRPPKKQLPSIAAGLNAFKGTQEQVRLVFTRKRSNPNEFRLTLDFGIENRALQYLVLSVLYVIANLHPRQFGVRGGVPAAITHVRDGMKAGFVHATETDIKACYQSFDGDRITKLIPFPKKVVDSVLTTGCLNIVPPTHHPHIFGPADTEKAKVLLAKCLADARQGIPQGSAASPLLAEMLLAPLLSQLPTGSEVAGYVDNFLILAEDQDAAVATTSTLGSALKAHLAGQLTPKIKSFPPGGPVEFLGHHLTARQGLLEIEPSPSNRKKFKRRLNRGLAYLKRPTTSAAGRSRKVRELKSYLSSWTENFRLCAGVEVYKANWLAKIMSASHVMSTLPKPGKEHMASKTKMIFPLYPDQHKIVTLALKAIGEVTGTPYQAVQLEYMAQDYFGMGLHFSDWKSALLYARNQSTDLGAFLQSVMEYLESICPEATITAEITLKEQVAS
jgi:hypothetical protein